MVICLGFGWLGLGQQQHPMGWGFVCGETTPLPGELGMRRQFRCHCSLLHLGCFCLLQSNFSFPGLFMISDSLPPMVQYCSNVGVEQLHCSRLLPLGLSSHPAGHSAVSAVAINALLHCLWQPDKWYWLLDWLCAVVQMKPLPLSYTTLVCWLMEFLLVLSTQVLEVLGRIVAIVS